MKENSTLLHNLSELDLHIIQVAANEFMKHGIDNVDMKEIAKKAEISRTTLYRHFANKDALATYVTLYTLLYCQNLDVTLSDDMNGYQKLNAYIKALCDFYEENPNITHYIAEFDLRFTDMNAQDMGLADIYNDNMRNINHLHDIGQNQMPLNSVDLIDEAIKEGQNDGSIKNEKPSRFIAYTLINAIKSMAATIMLRKEHLKAEQGYGIEMMDYFIELLMTGLKAE